MIFRRSPYGSRFVSARRLVFAIALLSLGASSSHALDKPEKTYTIFQFPRDQIPRIDGNTDDWALVPEAYAIGTDQLRDDSSKHAAPDPKNLEVRVKVGWVKGLNRLYFLYEATDNYWNFSQPGLHNDTFELIVDGDASGGPLIDKGNAKFWIPQHIGEAAAAKDDRISVDAAHWAIQGVHAQNYHIFTPAVEKDWCMSWNAASWVKDFPWANSASSFHFKPGEGGKFTLEFWITPFDYAGPEGPQRAVESVLTENKIIGMSWAVIDYDDAQKKGSSGFWNLSTHHTMYGDASELCAFRLMPLEPQFLKTLKANWTFKVVDLDRRVVAFQDLSIGGATAWKWDFGDGTSSTEQHPIHTFAQPASYITVLEVTGPTGTSRFSQVWAVQLK